jgi:hypothetical protein
MRERLAVLKDTPLTEQDTPLPGKQTPLPREDHPLPETPPQSEGMTTRAQTRAGGGKIKHVPSARATRQQVHLARPPPPAHESTGQAQTQQQALEDEDKLMQRRGQLRAQAEDEDGQDGPSAEKQLFNRGERREHDADWEEPLLKRIKHLKEMTMRAEAARAGKRCKHAVTALSVIGYEAGQRNLYRCLASMTDVELLAALATGNFELSLEGSTFPPATPPTATLNQGPQRPPALQQPEPASHHPASTGRNQTSLLDQQRHASPLDQQRGTAGQGEASQGQQDGDSQTQPGYGGQKQPRGDQQAAGTPQAQLPTAQPGATANGRKTRQTKKKALKRYWARVFRQGE